MARPSTLHERARTLVAAAIVAFYPAIARAGPPYLTDDPDIVGVQHWEFFLASQWAATAGSVTGTSPHIEINYGVLERLQVGAVIPTAFSWSPDRSAIGAGDLQLDAKIPFVDEDDSTPKAAFSPVLTLPTGSAKWGLGEGGMSAYVPFVMEKSFGSWTTFGGGGIRIAGDRSSVLFGWLLQRDIATALTLGGEAFLTAPLQPRPFQLQLDAGGEVHLSKVHEVIFSAGPSFSAEMGAQGYFAYHLSL